nr:MAG TPA: hypothetical protein [Caudoviricetes sp.]
MFFSAVGGLSEPGIRTRKTARYPRLIWCYSVSRRATGYKLNGSRLELYERA